MPKTDILFSAENKTVSNLWHIKAKENETTKFIVDKEYLRTMHVYHILVKVRNLQVVATFQWKCILVAVV